MDADEFRDALLALDPDDREGLVTAVQERVRALSRRHLDIQERIESSDRAQRDLRERLQAAERAIVEQADASVETAVDSIEDVESLPPDADVEFDPELLAEVREIREQARSTHDTTAADESDLQAELARNGEELRLHRTVLTDLEEGDCTTAEARDRLLAFFEDDGDGTEDDPVVAPGDEPTTGDGAGDSAGADVDGESDSPGADVDGDSDGESDSPGADADGE